MSFCRPAGARVMSVWRGGRVPQLLWLIEEYGRSHNLRRSEGNDIIVGTFHLQSTALTVHCGERKSSYVLYFLAHFV